ncbi:hypothetical protein H0H81_000152 [Sphagnurus paluster]|uniref:G domain-containing protein n=1 Tax=Sphagnurus paluster TaxID=117069 RepID=A0A9P7GHS3_9AGAR|nr:hypothetical protein H0H81_000152 [Sphagnurus paluster]
MIFVNALLGNGNEVAKVGHDLQSETMSIQHYIIPSLSTAENRVIVLDTPGLDDTDGEDTLTDLALLKRIADWFNQSYANEMHIKLAGVIYLHEITQTRMLRMAQENLDTFHKLCSQRATKNTILVTTKWSHAKPAVAIEREKQLKDEHWKEMSNKGSRIARLNPPESTALGLVKLILARNTANQASEIQAELVEIDMFLAETEAGRTLNYTLKDLLVNQRKMAERLQEEQGEDVHQQVKENDKKIKGTLKQFRTLKTPWRIKFSRPFGLARLRHTIGADTVR